MSATPTLERELPAILPPIGDATPKELINGVTFQWLNDETCLFTITDVHREAVDMYIDTNIAMLNNWDKSKTMRVMHDISHDNVSLTPYFRKRLNDVVPAINASGVSGISGVVMGGGFMETIIVFFGNAFNRKTPTFKQRYFTDQQKCLDWVKNEPPK